jgi:3-oxoacyl-[acyl-carrier protein] reductase
MRNLLDLTDRVAIVTGGGKGIGAATAEVLAEHGARLVIAGRDVSALERRAQSIRRAFGRDVLWFKADVTAEADVVSLVGETLKRFGRVDILVNNAGGPKRSAVEETSIENWDEVIATNLRSVFLCTREAGRHMLAQRKGAIVNISSLAGVNAVSIAGAYGAAKAGVQNFTQAVSNAWARHGVRVNAIAAGTIQHDEKVRPPEAVARICAAIPMGRLGEAKEIAHAVLFLASDAASYITGATLIAGGGLVDPEPSAF